MDSSAYLKSHGWRGAGHSLDQTGRGLKKPLLVSHKVDVLGVGKQKHLASDQWWMRAFDESLKQIGTGQKTALDSIRKNGVHKGGLYGFFVKGEALQGTVSDPPPSSESPTTDTAMSPSFVGEAAPATFHPTATEILSQALGSDTLEVVNYDTGRKRKKEHEPAKEVRKRRKLQAAEEARENSRKNREKAIADGTFDYAADEIKRKQTEINRIVKANIEKRLKAGEFGTILPHPNAGKGGPKKRVMDPVTGKMVSYKAEKLKREKNKRVAKAAEKERMTRLLYPELLPPSVEDGATPEEVLEWQRQEKQAKKEKRQAKADKEAARKARAEAEAEMKRQAKAERRKERAAQKEETAIGLALQKGQHLVEELPEEPVAMEVETVVEVSDKPNDHTAETEFVNLAATTNGVPGAGTTLPVAAKSRAQLIRENLTAAKPAAPSFDPQEDEIKLGVTRQGRTKKIPGVGAVDKYPTKAEKKQKKLESKAFEAGLTLDQYKAKLDREKWEEDAPERERIAQVQASRGGLTAKEYRKQTAKARDAAANAIYLATGKYPLPGTYDVAEIMSASDLSHWIPKDPPDMPDLGARVEAEIVGLSDKKRAQYTERAELKGLSLNDYLSKRLAKKDKAAGSGFVVDVQGDSTLTGQPSMPVVGNDLGFVVDTHGDSKLTNATKGDKPPLRWHPDMLGSREVKDLSKEERAARLEWMRARRSARHEAAGRNPVSKKERAKLRMEKKMVARNRIVYDMLQAKAKEEGKSTNEKVSKQELLDARRAAKRQMREVKRIKRNKVIHRKNENMQQRISTGKV